MSDETARWARVEAAKCDTSVSRWIGELLDERRRTDSAYRQAMRSYRSRSATPLKHPGNKYPDRAERHERT